MYITVSETAGNLVKQSDRLIKSPSKLKLPYTVPPSLSWSQTVSHVYFKGVS